MDGTEDMSSSSTARAVTRLAIDKRRTLRTYSKRSRSAEDDAAPKPAKKQRTLIEETAVPRPSELPTLPPPPPPAHTSNIPKSSILSYFKPCRSSSATEPSDPLSDSEKLVSTPPSSPPVIRRIREPRRLRLRPSTTIHPSSDDVDCAGDENEENKDAEEKSTRRLTRSTRRDRKQLQEANDSKLNERESPVAKSKQLETAKKPPVRSKAAATIQTTINISSKPTFEECKTCRIVYNPLHPPDVKYHSQRHAAYLRSRAKA